MSQTVQEEVSLRKRFLSVSWNVMMVAEVGGGIFLLVRWGCINRYSFLLIVRKLLLML